MKRPWYAEGLQFECTRCAACCTGDPGYVWVTDAEVEALAAAKGMTVESFRERFLREVGDKSTIKERPNGDCEMLNGKTCAAYEQRPAQCRTFPFWPEYIDSRHAWMEAARKCPGMNCGKLYACEEIAGLLRR